MGVCNNVSSLKFRLTRSTGIVRCDMIAESIIAAAAATKGFKVPVVVRLQGTNCDKGLEMVRIYIVPSR
jgi:succinyl-CoA synthetase beta subunit